MRRFFVLFCCITALAGCGGAYAPTIRLALDGPPLALVMRGENALWEGFMDRGCMAGVGTIILYGPDGVVCKDSMDHPANDKGRLYADLACADGGSMTLIFRNLGPDQGMGLGRLTPDTIPPEAPHEERLTLFYHPSPAEARRRLDEVRRELAAMFDPNSQ